MSFQIPVTGSPSRSAIESTSEPTGSTLMERAADGSSKATVLRGTTGLRSDGYLQGGVVVPPLGNFTAGDAHIYRIFTDTEIIVVSLPQAATVPGREEPVAPPASPNETREAAPSPDERARLMAMNDADLETYAAERNATRWWGGS